MSSRTERADYFPKARAEVENQSCIVSGKHGEVTGKNYRRVVMCNGPRDLQLPEAIITSIRTFDSDTLEASGHPVRCLVPVDRTSCPF